MGESESNIAGFLDCQTYIEEEAHDVTGISRENCRGSESAVGGEEKGCSCAECQIASQEPAMRLKLWFLLPALASFHTGCQTTLLPTPERVDIQRYSGRWYEIARVKNRFQRNNERAFADYEPISATSIRIRNGAITRSGKIRTVVGTGEVAPASGGAKLRVNYGGLAALAPVSRQGNYWIMAVDSQYRSALVGTPNRKLFWILSRQPSLDAGTINTYMAKAEHLGFSTEKLIWDQDLPKKAKH